MSAFQDLKQIIKSKLDPANQNYKSIKRVPNIHIKRGTTRTRRSLLEAKQAGVNMRLYKDNMGNNHIVYLTTKPVTYFSFEYPPETLHEYYDEWGWPIATANNLNISDSLNNSDPNRPGTPDPGQGGAKRMRKTGKRSKRKTRRGRK